MKTIIEVSDIKEVQFIANDWYGVILTPTQAEELIRENTKLATELVACKGSLDTQGREVLSEAMVKHVLKGMPGPKNPDRWESGWHWPLNGSTQEYKDEFDAKFKEAAKLKGYKLSKGWDEK
jgi:hypothetical protein